jgi:hypothetical protein
MTGVRIRFIVNVRLRIPCPAMRNTALDSCTRKAVRIAEANTSRGIIVEYFMMNSFPQQKVLLYFRPTEAV